MRQSAGTTSPTCSAPPSTTTPVSVESAVRTAGSSDATEAPAERGWTPTEVEAIWLAARADSAAFQIDSFPMSPSRLGVYNDCPRRLFYDRVLGIRDDGSIYLTVGSLFHTLMENVGNRFPARAAIVDSLRTPPPQGLLLFFVVVCLFVEFPSPESQDVRHSAPP